MYFERTSWRYYPSNNVNLKINFTKNNKEIFNNLEAYLELISLL